MSTSNITLIYFSPTNTTRTVLKSIAEGMGGTITREVNLTRPENRVDLSDLIFDGPVLLGAPVYGGRLPKDAVQSFKTLKASKTPAVLVVLYGNREYEDALLELKDIAVDADFNPVAAAAFIGEHSFSSNQLPIAPGRPNVKDLETAEQFGRKVAGLLESQPDLISLEVSGNFPYKDGMPSGAPVFIQVTDQCDDCGICVASCPSEAIDEADRYATIASKCILCCACIKACPNQARVMMDGPLMDKAKWLYANCAEPKEPEFFYGT